MPFAFIRFRLIPHSSIPIPTPTNTYGNVDNQKSNQPTRPTNRTATMYYFLAHKTVSANETGPNNVDYTNRRIISVCYSKNRIVSFSLEPASRPSCQPARCQPDKQPIDGRLLSSLVAPNFWARPIYCTIQYINNDRWNALFCPSIYD